MEPMLLHIDPHPATRLLVEKVLAAEAFVVRQAHTGLDGQQSAATLRPDLILVDVDRVRGGELVSALRRLPGLAHVRLLASTADARPEYLEKMLAWGFDRVWLQPLDIDTLARDLRLALPSPPPSEVSGEAPPATGAMAPAGWLEPWAADSRNGTASAIEAAPPVVNGAAHVADEPGSAVVEAACAMDDGASSLALGQLAGEAHAVDDGVGELAGEAHGLDNGVVGLIGEAHAVDDGVGELAGEAHGLDNGVVGLIGEAHAVDDGVGELAGEAHGLDNGVVGLIGEAHAVDDGVGELAGEAHGLDDGVVGLIGEARGVDDVVVDLVDEAHGLGNGRVELVEVAVPGTLDAPALDPETPGPPLAPVEVAVLWRLSLTPLIAQLVRSTASTEGVLALLDQDGGALVIVATVGSRHGDNGSAGKGGAAVGTRVPSRGVPWIHPALHGREVVVVAAETIAPGPLAPPGRPALLIVPVASRERVRGVAILGKHRTAREPAFAPGKVARSLAQAQQIAGIVEMLEALDRAAAQRRQELEDLRRQSVRDVLSEVAALARPPRRNGAGAETMHSSNGEGSGRDLVIGLGLRVADRLGLPARKREVLRQALEVRDVGRAWVEHVLFARATFSAAGRERLLDRATEHGAQILSALDWPPAVVELVRVHQAQRNGEGPLPGPGGGDVPIEARLMAVMSAYGALVTGREGDAAAVREALAELSRQGHDPEVVDALMGLALARGASELEPR